MKKQTVIGVFALVMVVLNIGLLCFVWSKKRPHHPLENTPQALIAESLAMDESQQAEYNLLVEEHQEAVHLIRGDIFELKTKLYQTLSNDNEELKDTILVQIQKEVLEMEKLHYRHFLDIKNLCAEDQLDAFNELTKEIADIFNRKGPLKK